MNIQTPTKCGGLLSLPGCVPFTQAGDFAVAVWKCSDEGVGHTVYVLPILFLDVDGVLNARVMPYHEYVIEVPNAELASHAFANSFTSDIVELHVYLHSALDEWLAELGGVYEIVWATTWEHLANKHLSALLGLGELGVVEFSANPPNDEYVRRSYVAEWKWDQLVPWAGVRPFVFVDDLAQRVSANYPLQDGVAQCAVSVEYGLTRELVDELVAHALTLAAS
jgi:hypothetical protein